MADDKKKSKKRRRRRVAKGSVKKALKTMSRVPTAVSMFKKVGFKKPVPSLNLLLNSAIGGPAGNTRQQLARQQQLTDTTIATQTDVGGGIGLAPGGYGNYGSRSSRSSDVQLRSRTPSSQFRSAIQSPNGSPAHSQPTSRNPSAGAIGRDGVPLYFDTATPRVRLISPPGPDWSPPQRYLLRPTKAREARKKKGSRIDPIVISPNESMLSSGRRRQLPSIPTQVSQTPGILSESWIDPRASWDRRQRLEDIHDEPGDMDLTLRSRMRKWFGRRWGLNQSQGSQGGARADAVSPPSGPSPGMLFSSQRQKDMYTGRPDEISTIWDEPQPVGLNWNSPEPDPMFGIQTPKQLSAAGLDRHSTPQFSQSNYGEGFYEPSVLMGNFPTPDIGNLDESPRYSPMMRPPSQQTDYPMPSHEPTEAFWDMLPRAPTVPQEILPNVITSAVRAQDPSNIPFSLESPEGIADSLREDPREMPSSLNLPVLTPTEQRVSDINTQRLIASQSQRRQSYIPRPTTRPISAPISARAAQEKQTVVGGQRKSRRQRGLEPKSSGST